MEFPVDCECGRRIMVREGLAGTRRTCECGRVLLVPSLHELRRDIGLTPYEVSPELVVESLLLEHRLPADRFCVCCGTKTDDVLNIHTECERTQVRGSGRQWPVLFLPGLLFGFIIWKWHRQTVQELGKDKIYALPLAICRDCQPTLLSTRDIKQALRQVPEYARLLDKFPDAAVRAD
jgi:hypothetical protein